MIQETLLTILQIFATFLIAGTLFVYFLQLRAMQEQVKAARNSDRSQVIIALVDLLQNDATRDARAVVYQIAESSKPHAEWTEIEQRAASKVCSTFDVAGILIKQDLSLLDTFRNWKPSVIRTYEALEIYIHDMRSPDKAGYEMWQHFQWLYNELSK